MYGIKDIMNTDGANLDLQTLKRSNTELKRALRHFIESAPNHGSLKIQIDNIRNALKSNESMFTFASLVEQYVKMKKNFDNVDHQSQQRDIKALKAILKKTRDKTLSTEQLEKVDEVIEGIAAHEPIHAVLVKTARALESFGSNLSQLREASNVVVAEKDIETDETSVVAADIHLASKKLIKDVIVISKQLSKTYPEDKFIREILIEANNIPDSKGTFFAAVNILERTTTYIALLIQKERCAAEEMLNDIHASLVDAFGKTTVIEKLVESSKDESKGMKNNMVLQLKNMEVKARAIDTLEGMQQHIKDNVALMSDIMNDYAKTQNEIHQSNEATIFELNSKIESTSQFVEKLEQKLNVAEEVNLVDELTTVGNRKGYVYQINKERKDWIASKQPLSLLVIDVDHFKSINDNFGHSIGDQVLKCLGQTIKKNIRSTDYVARYGGEEFVVILPASNMKTALGIAHKLQEVINALKFELRRKNKVLRITCSFGLAQFSDKLMNTTEVFNLADKALYHAKESGRNCIVTHTGDNLVIDSTKETS